MDLGAQGSQVSHLQGAGWAAATLLRIISENVDSTLCLPPLVPDTPLLPYVPRTHSPTRPWPAALAPQGCGHVPAFLGIWGAHQVSSLQVS